MIVSTLCYLEKEKQFLMLYRNKKENDLNEGKWIGVGGKLEEGETVDECVVREVYEETGLTLTGYELAGVVKFVSDTWEDEDMYLYYGYDYEGTLTDNCSEGELKWVARDKVLDLPTWEGDRYFLKPFLEGDRNIDMTVCYEKDVLVKFSDNHEPVETLKSTLIDCKHGFSTRHGGISEGIYESLNLGMNRGDDKMRVIENWRRFLISCDIERKEFVCGNQVHKNTVHIVSSKDLRPAYGPGELIEADGYVTNEPNVPLSIFTADCVPVLMEDKENHVIAAIHCGWRSTVSDILKSAIEKMREIGGNPETVVAAIGPSIDRCCFEVGGEVIEAVKNLLNEDAADLYEQRGDKYMLDLRGVVRRQLTMLGVRPENIENVGGCTMCNPKDFWSHRYTKGERGSQASIISL